jgi:hypothetical protein
MHIYHLAYCLLERGHHVIVLTHRFDNRSVRNNTLLQLIGLCEVHVEWNQSLLLPILTFIKWNQSELPLCRQWCTSAFIQRHYDSRRYRSDPRPLVFLSFAN